MTTHTVPVFNNSGSVAGYAVHNSESDTVYTSLFENEAHAAEVRMDEGSKDLLCVTCKCGRQQEPCWISGDTFEWRTVRCCVCMVITGPRSPQENLGTRPHQVERDAKNRCPKHPNELLATAT